MGAPLSMYQLLTQIQQNGHRLQLPFKLYAFVLYDKEEHPYIAAYMQQHLVSYHRAIGKNMLFFEPHANFPPQVLKDTRRYFTRYLAPEEWDGQSGMFFNPYGSQFGQHTVGHSLSVSSVIAQLGLGSDELPCVIVTPDLRADTYYMVRLSERADGDDMIKQPFRRFRINIVLYEFQFISYVDSDSFERLLQKNPRLSFLLSEHHSRCRMVDLLIDAYQ